MDPFSAILSAIAQAFVSEGIRQALPQKSTTRPLDVPQSGNGQMDFNQLLQQQRPSTQQPRLQLQNRLPRPGAY